MMGAREVAIIAYQGVDELDLMGVLAPLRKAEEAAKSEDVHEITRTLALVEATSSKITEAMLTAV